MVLVVWPLQANGTLCIRFVSHSLPLFLVCLVLFTVWAPHVACSPPCHQQQQQQQPCGWVCVIGGVPVPSVGVGGGGACVWCAERRVVMLQRFGHSLPLSHVRLLPSLCTCFSPLPNCFVGTGAHPSPLALAVMLLLLLVLRRMALGRSHIQNAPFTNTCPMLLVEHPSLHNATLVFNTHK